MAIDITAFCRRIKPEKTKILFGAGSSLPSGGPTGRQLSQNICEKFSIDYDQTLSLSEIAMLAEMHRSRKELITHLQATLGRLKPTAGLLNLPLFDWSDIFTTNYDTLIEQSYARSKKKLNVLSSNFDFDDKIKSDATSLFKLHGTLNQDRATGHRSSMVITTTDYDLALQYRELVFDRFLHETSKDDVIIIGHSLADPDLNIALEEALRRKKSSGSYGNLYALIYNEDKNRASLAEQRGYQVCFAGLDQFFAQLMVEGPERKSVFVDAEDALGRAPELRPMTIDVGFSLASGKSNAIQLFNGTPATYCDVRAGLTFVRDLGNIIETQLVSPDSPLATVLAPAGFGKTTLCRQIVTALDQRGYLCWEHKADFKLNGSAWKTVASHCETEKKFAVLFVDDAHVHLRGIDLLVDHLATSGNRYFKLLLSTTPGHWHPRSKTPNIYNLGIEHTVRRLSHTEISSLLEIFDRQTDISSLVESSFAGFSRQERMRRLTDRCQADMFVCMKNIFSFDNLDDIILRDYATIEKDLQDIYRAVAAMEASNIRVHRQLVMRILGIPANYIQGILDRLTGIIWEYDVDAKNGIYGWRGRHEVISEIILKYKYHEQDELYRLYNLVIDNINPTYEIERMTINELCDIHAGIGRLRNKQRQNYLYRKMISVAPGQRPPRHRLIYNLIKSGELDPAANEIRIFEKELKRDAPIMRYKAQILVERANGDRGLLEEDRLAILGDAANIVINALEQFPADKSLHALHCDIGLRIMKIGGDWSAFDVAIELLAKAEHDYLDPELGRLRARISAHRDTLSADWADI